MADLLQELEQELVVDLAGARLVATWHVADLNVANVGQILGDRFDQAGGDPPAGVVGSEDGDGRVLTLM